MHTSTATLPLTYVLVETGALQALAVDDQQLPPPVSATYPAPFGGYWSAGAVITHVFGPLAPADLVRLISLNGTRHQVTVWTGQEWSRGLASISFSGNTLTATLVNTLAITFMDRRIYPSVAP